MSGPYQARASFWVTDAHRRRCAALASLVTSRPSAAKLFTTRTPCTFSSTMVVISAARACTIHDSGNSRLRSRTPRPRVNGSVISATRVRGTLMVSIITMATTTLTALRAISGAKVQ